MGVELRVTTQTVVSVMARVTTLDELIEDLNYLRAGGHPAALPGAATVEFVEPGEQGNARIVFMAAKPPGREVQRP